jgi:hypothetical protein
MFTYLLQFIDSGLLYPHVELTPQCEIIYNWSDQSKVLVLDIFPNDCRSALYERQVLPLNSRLRRRDWVGCALISWPIDGRAERLLSSKTSHRLQSFLASRRVVDCCWLSVSSSEQVFVAVSLSSIDHQWRTLRKKPQVRQSCSGVAVPVDE